MHSYSTQGNKEKRCYLDSLGQLRHRELKKCEAGISNIYLIFFLFNIKRSHLI